MQLAERFELPEGLVARPYAGTADHSAMAELLTITRLASATPELATAEHFDQSYPHLTDCDPDVDIALIEADGELIAYSRPTFHHLESGTTDLTIFAPTHPDHLTADLFHALASAQETHLLKWVTPERGHRYRAGAVHPGPGKPPTGEAAWLEDRGYVATEWGAALLRPHLDDIPERSLPDGVEVRPVTPDQMRHIVEVYHEAFRGEWGFTEMTEHDITWIIDDPNRDETLWKVAWAGDTVVGQVKPYINHEENAARGYLRGYTEYIATHRNWRNRGIAGALLTLALQEIKDRGMTSAMLGVDTNNPGGAFQLYTGLGFELQTYEAVYIREIDTT
jgi:ribosomal protein S18 acetylase RimI-like enzyme